MSMPRYGKRDLSESDIVKALRKAGFQVYVRLPCDLLVWRPDKGWQTLENKTPTKTGRRRKRKDQEAQDAFIALTRTPVALTPEDALRALGAIT